MEEYSGKRAAAGVGSSRRGCSLAFRDNHEDRSIRYCNHLGCSIRHNSLVATQIGNPEKLSSGPSFLSTRGKAAVGNSSRKCTSLNVHKKPQQERGNSPSLPERVTMEISGRQKQVEDASLIVGEEEMITGEVDPPSAGLQTVLPDPEDLESSFIRGFLMSPTEASTKCQVTSISRARKPSNRKMESGNPVVSSTSSSVRHSVLPKNVNRTVKQSQSQGAIVYRHGLRNLSCTSISDVLPSGCSSSDVGHNKRMDALRKRDTDVQSSSARGKGTAESSNRGHPSVKGGSSGRCLSPLEQPSSQPVSRRRNRLTSGDRFMSVRTQRSDSSNTRRLLENVDADTFFLPEHLISSSSQGQSSFCETSSASSSQSFSTDLVPFHPRSSAQSGSSRTPYTRQMDHSEDSTLRILHGPWVNRDGYRHLNMEGIAEVLLALDRIEQDEELTYEQVMALDSNLFLGGISFHDQHRDMRLDIDNMSYEELLDLEEKMGTVSTALSEAALSRCLDKSIYTPLLGAGFACGDDDDVKCSICQEEYIVGDEVGKLHCDHCYHVACINQWLRRKNWCPICKASACPSSSFSAHH